MKHDITRFLQPAEIGQLSGLAQTGPGQALIKLLTAVRASDRNTNENRPQINDAVINKDFRYVAGGISRLTAIIDAPAAAAQVLEEAAKRQKALENKW